MHILRWFVAFAFCLIAVSGCGSSGSSGSSGPEASWTYVGTWVNPTYSSGNGAPARVVFTTDTLAFYTKDSDTMPWATGSLTVTDDWTADGGHYFKATVAYTAEGATGTGCILARVTGNNNTLECNTSSADCPAVISSTEGQYGIWSRQQ